MQKTETINEEQTYNQKVADHFTVIMCNMTVNSLCAMLDFLHQLIPVWSFYLKVYWFQT